jgi:ABC-2 type transport system ATP-binding protein
MMAESLAIATYNLTKQYDDRHTALTQVELQVKTGEVYGLIGPNGAGKTTLIRMLAIAEQPTVGEIFLFGDRLQHNGRDDQIKQRLGYLPDDYPLYDDLSVWEYLDYFARLYHLANPRRRQRLGEVLELVQLTSKRHSAIATLSRGMKQRLSLARTLIHEPLLLLLDEPVSGLDPIARSQFREIIKSLQLAGMTILISSHVLSDLAELCNSVGIMELGYLVESASLSDLYQRLAQQCITIQTLGNLDHLVQMLRSHPHVDGWEIQPDHQSVQINFVGNQDASAELLRSLILEGIAISQFHCHQEDLESIFLKLGHQQVS